VTTAVAADRRDASDESDDRAARRAHGSDRIEQAAEVAVVAALVVELVAMFGNVIARSLFDTSLLWSLEIGELALVMMTFLGGAIAYPRNEHMALHAVVQRLPARWHGSIEALCHWQVFVMAVIGCWLAWRMMLSRWDERTVYLGLSAIWSALPMLLGMALLAWFAVRRVLLRPRRQAVGTGIAAAVLVALTFAVAATIGSEGRSYALSVAFAVFALQLVLGVPIGFALLMVTLLFLYTSKIVPLSVVPINLQNGISSFVMLSIPFFILAGYVMTEGGLSRRLTHFVISIVGRFRGGMLQVIVLCMYVMSGISGSKVADVAAVGTTMKGVMHKEGYDPGETAAVLASGAVMGETVPPSIAMLVLASVTSLSIGTLFAAGLLPAAVMALCLMVLIHFRSRRRARTAATYSSREIVRAGVRAIPALVAPLILIGGIVSGIATPTEVSSTAVIYALVLSVVLYRSLKAKQLLASHGKHRSAGRHGPLHHQHGEHAVLVADAGQDSAADRRPLHDPARLGDALHDRDHRHAGADGRAARRPAGALDLRAAAAADGRGLRHRRGAVRHRPHHRHGPGRLLAADRRRHVRHLLDLRHDHGERDAAHAALSRRARDRPPADRLRTLVQPDRAAPAAHDVACSARNPWMRVLSKALRRATRRVERGGALTPHGPLDILCATTSP
jgi:TRAP-type C4-dicarboxylate transport system permease small subunit